MDLKALTLIAGVALAAGGCAGGVSAPRRPASHSDPSARSAGAKTARKLRGDLRRRYGRAAAAKAFWYDEVRGVSFDPASGEVTVATRLFNEPEDASSIAAICRAVLLSRVKGIESARLLSDDGQPLRRCDS